MASFDSFNVFCLYIDNMVCEFLYIYEIIWIGKNKVFIGFG